MITPQNITEYILLAIDNELTAAELQALEQYLQAHPQAQQQYNSLKATVLQPIVTEAYPQVVQLHAIANNTNKKAKPIYWQIAAAIALVLSLTSIAYLWQQKAKPVELVNNTTNKNSIPDTNKYKVASMPVIVNNTVATPQSSTQNTTEAVTSNKASINTVKATQPTVIQELKNEEAPASVVATIARVPDTSNIVKLDAISNTVQPISTAGNTPIVMANTATIASIKPLPKAANEEQQLFIQQDRVFLNKLKKSINTAQDIYASVKAARENGLALEVSIPHIFKKNKSL
jgi:hypothetical protein